MLPAPRADQLSSSHAGALAEVAHTSTACRVNRGSRHIAGRSQRGSGRAFSKILDAEVYLGSGKRRQGVTAATYIGSFITP